jgi:hypothetical protein
MDTVQKLRAVLLSFMILSFICLISMVGVYVVNQTMEKIGLWVISYILLSMYILLRASTYSDCEEEYLILTIMAYMLWKDEQDEYFWTFMTVILSISILLIGLVKYAKYIKERTILTLNEDII